MLIQDDTATIQFTTIRFRNAIVPIYATVEMSIETVYLVELLEQSTSARPWN